MRPEPGLVQRWWLRDRRGEEEWGIEDGTLAGSATNLFDCMRRAIEFGISPEDAIKAASVTPAKSIGIYPEVVSLKAGAKADVLILDEEFNLEKVI